MAFLKRRKSSRFWSVCWVDENGIRQQKSTGFRTDDPKDTDRAYALEARLTAEELEGRTHDSGELWAVWVPDFLKRHCRGKSAKTYARYSLSWQHLASFLGEHGVRRPSDLKYQHCLAYLAWRQKQKRRSGKSPALNTALHEMTALKIVMRQALRLGFVTTNVCDRLGIAKDRPSEKPELTDADIVFIREKLQSESEWMQHSFEIALHTGCRSAETSIAFRNIDFTRKTITFTQPKGGKSRAFTAPLPDNLVPLFQKIHATGAERTVKIPPMPSKLWWQFFVKIGRKDLCFHCTRVTFVTRLARAGVPLSVAMRLVNHSSTLVHRIYQRLSVEDVSQWTRLVQFPAQDPVLPASGATPEHPST